MRIGVLLLNLGGPARSEDVKPFLYNLFSDPEIIRLPVPFLQKPLAWLISTLRAPLSLKNYASIGGKSPIKAITAQQGRVLKKTLARRGIEVKVYVGMRYWHPYTEAALTQIKADGIEKLVVLPLYPQYSISTSGSSYKLLNQAWAEDPQLQQIERRDILSFYDRPGYIRGMVRLIHRELAKFEQPERVHILFSAHGVPKSYVETGGDPYQQQIEASVQLLTAALALPNRSSLAYQSKVGPVEWLQPYTEDIIPRLARQGVTNLLTIPISFISEHIETLQEIDIEYRHLAHESGIPNFRRVRTLNIEPDFINELALLVQEQLDDRVLQPS
ncbi:ferrochelatase [Candidatus Cyanaurora vandensis]|uniref:ferrochelatase n=1 Tax=Candidatus Cyanaurora vandensis TaxID=2714958 RepID=UPI00257CCF84|nr:ferrochelatase [Candidatus Cyanaurora vandensis]